MFTEGSTGKIMLAVADCARENGHTVFTYSPYGYFSKFKKMPQPLQGHRYYSSYTERRFHNIIGRLFGCNGCLSVRGTRKLVRELKNNHTEVLHLHNLHSYCINFPILFKYIKKYHIKVVWTLHDCWAFTGHCPHFDRIGCDKWKSGCNHCPQYRQYPQSRIDNARYQYCLKQKWFTNVENMVLVAPSEWLAARTRESFLKEYPVRVIRNGIDLSVFKPTESDFRQQYHLEDKIVLLGVAYGWSIAKGLDVFIELAQRLDDRYRIVLVGTNEAVDGQLPERIISIHKTQDQAQLAAIYTAADILVNPTREEVLGLVNIEALACGTPVITFNSGGSPECVDESCGAVIERDDIDCMEEKIIQITSARPFSQEACVRRAIRFNEAEQYKAYIDLYENLPHSKT